MARGATCTAAQPWEPVISSIAKIVVVGESTDPPMDGFTLVSLSLFRRQGVLGREKVPLSGYS